MSAAALALGSAANSGKLDPLIKSTAKTRDFLMKTAVFVALGVGGYFLLRRVVNKAGANTAESQAGKDPHIAIAIEMRNAMNPSGNSALFNVDKTDEKGLYRAAAKIKRIDRVISAYRRLYGGDSLLDDLKSELDNKELDKVLTIMKEAEAKAKETAKNKGLTPNNMPSSELQQVRARVIKREPNWGRNPALLDAIPLGGIYKSPDSPTAKNRLTVFTVKDAITLKSKTPKYVRFTDSDGLKHWRIAWFVQVYRNGKAVKGWAFEDQLMKQNLEWTIHTIR